MGRPFIPHISEVYKGVSYGGCLHLQMASQKRLLWKHFWYVLVEHLRWPQKPIAEINAMYGRTVSECMTARTCDVHPHWWEPYTHLMQHLDLNAEPWQKADALRIIAENPGIEKGLTEFGCLNES